jgi:hypothetical protein
VPRLLADVPANPIHPNVIAGGVAAAATTGALVAIGHRLGSAGLPFAAIGGALFQRTAASGAPVLVFSGFALHFALMYVWSAGFLWLAARLPRREIRAAAVVATVHFLVTWTVASVTGRGLGSVLALGDLLVFEVVLALSWLVGIRLAFSSVRERVIEDPDPA